MLCFALNSINLPITILSNSGISDTIIHRNLQYRFIFVQPKRTNLPKIIFTVTNDLSYDQRMQRICNSLKNNGYTVLLVGREVKSSIKVKEELFQQKRLACFFEKGILFYIEFNLRLFVFLLTEGFDAICAIDLDTILPCYFASVIKKKVRIYDAHELFSEQKEIVTRPFIHRIWLFIERFSIPKFKLGYTVNQFIKCELKKRYEVNYEIVKNMPVLYDLPKQSNIPTTNFIIYQGSVNEGRGFETLIPAMKQVDCKLVICGKGNFFNQLKQLITENGVEEKVDLKGYLTPSELKQYTGYAKFGLTLFEPVGLNQYYSLSNRFFDYIMAGIPQVCVAYPEYKKVNDEFNIALMVEDIKINSLAFALNNLLTNDVLYQELKQNCSSARRILNWDTEEKKLIAFYHHVFEQ